MAAPAHVVAFEAFPGLARWARAVDILFHGTGEPTPGALALLPGAYAHVQSASALGTWMYEVSRHLDGSISYNLLSHCRNSEGVVPASSPFGVWMREVSAKIFVA